MRAENASEMQRTKLVVLLCWTSSLLVFLLLSIFVPAPVAGRSDVPGLLGLVSDTRILSILVEARNALATAAITFALFGVFLQLLLGSETTARLARSLTQAIFNNRELLDNFSSATKREFVINLMKSTLGDNIGSAVADGMVHPLMDPGPRFRRNFEYHINVLADADIEADLKGQTLGSKHLNTLFPTTRYRWIEECLTYQKFDPKMGEDGDGINRGPFNILLIFDKSALSTAYRLDNIFCRVMVDLDRSDQDVIFALEDSDFEALVREVMQLRCGIRKGAQISPVDFAVRVERQGVANDQGDRPGMVRIEVGAFEDTTSDSQLEIALRYPYDRSVSTYTVGLPQPVNGVLVKFSTTPDMILMEPMTYLTSARSEPIDRHDTRAHFSEIRLKGWIFPTSGITYSWKSKNGEDHSGRA